MKNRRSLMLEFLLLTNHDKTLMIEDESEELADEIPENDYSGDPLLPDELKGEFASIDDFIKSSQKNSREFEKDVPANDYQGDTYTLDGIPGDEDELSDEIPFDGATDDLANQVPDTSVGSAVPQSAGPDFSNMNQETPPEGMPPGGPEGMPPGGPEGMPPGGPEGMPPGGMPPDGMGGAGGMDMLGGMTPPTLDPISIGKVFIMKKIYSRMIATNNNLSYMTGPEFEDLKKYSSEALEHFQSVITNFDQFKDKLDEVITLFQQFLESLTSRIEQMIELNKMTSKE